MSWFHKVVRRLRGGRDDGEEVPAATPPELWTVADISFDVAGWRLVDSSPGSMSWSAPGGTLRLTCDDHEQSAVRSLVDLLTEMRAKARANGEDVVVLGRMPVRHGEALQAIYKRKDGLGCAYRGLIEVQQGTKRFRIASDLNEMRRTGTREAIVGAMLAQCGEFKLGPLEANGSRSILGYFHDAYDSAFDAGALNAITDDDRLDSILPNHPLSRIRGLHRTIASSLVLPDGAAAASGLTPPDSTGAEPTRPKRQLSSQVVRGILKAAKRFDEVEQSFSEEIASHGDGDSPELAKCLVEYGMFLQSRDRPDNAEIWLSRAERMSAATLGEAAIETVVARTQRGYALFKLGRKDEALPILLRSIETLEVGHPESPIHALALSGAWQILAERDDPRAIEFLNQLQAFMDTSSPSPGRPN